MTVSAGLVIVGGGLAGWALAHSLASQGVKDILLLEAQHYGSGASGVPWALLHPFPGRSLFPRAGYLEAWQTSLDWLSALQAQTSVSLYQRLPLWRVAYDTSTAERFARSFKRGKSLPDYPLQALSQTGPLPESRGAYGLTEGRLVRTPALLNLLREQTEIQHQAYTGPLGLNRSGESWRLQSDTLEISAKQVVLTTGSGLGELFPELPLASSRGEVLSFALDVDLQAAVSASGHFVVPLGEGRFHAGATHYEGRGLPPTASWELLKAGLGWLPGIENARLLSVWSGIRSGLKHDREPLVGPVPGHQGLWVMAGFSTRGLLLIPTAAQVLSDVLIGSGSAPAWMAAGRLRQEQWQLRD